MNGTEVAVKFPKIKLTLNPRYLKEFKTEVALQAKVRVSIIREATLTCLSLSSHHAMPSP